MIVVSEELTLKKIEAKNLSPFTQYYYQFNVCGSSNKSPLGSKCPCMNCMREAC